MNQILSNQPSLRAEIIGYCAKIGTDPLLIQGAGGNISWKEKEKNTLWVKASGCWLSEAGQKDIFVPVNLTHLRQAIAAQNFEVKPEVLEEYSLRPSIETIFHGLMPQKIVLHLHAVEILAHLIQKNCEEIISALIQALGLTYAFVDYHKPGAELAKYMALALEKNPDANVIFLKNHGVVIGAETINQVDQILQKLLTALALKPREPVKENLSKNSIKNYSPIPDQSVHQLALDPTLSAQLKSLWALFPDHVVFLGAEPLLYDSEEDFHQNSPSKAELFFIKGAGVFVSLEFTLAKQQQIRCYYDVLTRLKSTETIESIYVLSQSHINELLGWEAERYRRVINNIC